MKKIFLFFISVFTYHVSLAQYNLDDNFIGLPRDFIHSRMHEKGFDSFSPSKTLDNTDYDFYTLTSLKMSVTFFYKGDTCIRYMELGSKKDLSQITSCFDKRYDKVDSSHWINKKQSISVILTVPDEGALYTVAFTKIDFYKFKP